MTREEADFIGGMNMCDEISNEAYRKIMCHCEGQESCEDAISRQAVLDNIRAKILEEKECAYADFEQYKVEYLGVDAEYAEDELPYDDFRYGMERCIDIIDKYRKGGAE